MKTRKVSRPRMFLFTLLVLIFSGCVTLSKATLDDIQREPFEPLSLQPSFDVYGIRIDILRAKATGANSENDQEEDLAYRNLGFYLGNGLFYDLNKNLSLLVPELFCLDPTADFTIEESGLNKYQKTFYRREAETFVIGYSGLIPWEMRAEMQITDSSLVFDGGPLRRYSLSWTDTTLQQKGLFNSAMILPEPNGFFVPTIFFRRHFSQNDEIIDLENDYRLVRNENAILILRKNIMGKYKLRLTMIRSQSDWYIFDRYYWGLRISFRENELIVYKNQRKIKSYYLWH